MRRSVRHARTSSLSVDEAHNATYEKVEFSEQREIGSQ
jgi:hypothetical protein